MFSSVTLFSIFLMAIGLILVAGGALALWRFASLHSKGTPVIVRPLPASDGAAWRHGVMVYSESVLKVYKLRSLRPGADVCFSRHDVSIVDRRDPTMVEAGFFDDGLKVVRIQTRSVGQWELALDPSGDTALVAWVESSPSVRQTRVLPTDIEKRFRAVSDRQRGGQRQGHQGF
ncbi:DUF2550 domain-containing protein [Corynebacterium lactis]|uniref:DUF2550 domain-containing protein n=1 Tax=Corynebacterium lactis RW2-5 TaxID=1408189 RepID=A0A0K2GZ88_9CORY|nr:DUF2550 domain-containing protein [Corynebacterium lactis]ALA67104.1 hypothetical protein CLAC_04610 [Corynebacterium lactis RW2-5]